MAVYVYMYGSQKPKAMTAAWPHPWFGLTADTEEELHPFAEDLGMHGDLYRPRIAGSKVLPLVGHYDLDEGERDRAVAKGAIAQTGQKIAGRSAVRELRADLRQ